MKLVLLILIFTLSFNSSSQVTNVLWSDDFSDPTNWVTDNSNQSGPNYGWNINNTSQGHWSTSGNGMSTNGNSGGNNAELVNGDPNVQTQVSDVVYTLTNSTSIDISSLTNYNDVFIKFQQYGARFQDLQEIQISTDGNSFATVGDNSYHPILTNVNGTGYPNPELRIINISQYVSSNQTNVWIRFRWTSANPNASLLQWATFGWYIDDVELVQVNNQPVTQTLNEFSCDTYTSPTNQTYSQTGTYIESIENIYGLDSIIYTINLTIPIQSIHTIDTAICSGSSFWLNGSAFNQSGQFTQSLQTLQGCDSTIILNLTINPPITYTINTEICPGDTFILNGQNYTSGGTYTQSFQNSAGCDSLVNINVTELPDNFNLSFTANEQLFTSPPFAIQFLNTTSNMSNYNFTWYWGDGTSTNSNNQTVFHEYSTNGLYSVTLEAVNINTGCVDEITYIDYIYTTGGVSCTHSALLDQVGPILSCTGQLVTLSCNSDPTYTYQWRKNGSYISGNNNDSLIVIESGIYSVIISVNGCPVESSSIEVNFQSISTPIISATGNIQSCVGGTVTLSATSGFDSYLWSNGLADQDITVTSSGNYYVEVTDINGCNSQSLPYVVNASSLPIQNICIVGIDSLTNNLRVVWEKPLTNAIDSFYIYKESNVSNVYTKVGVKSYDELSVWIDPVSNTALQAYRYKMSALDTCGVETPLSDEHKSIHLTINQGVGNSWNLIWSHYEGLTFGSYNIYRGTSVSNMTLLTTIQGNLNSYTDLNPPLGIVYYQIEIVNSNTCSPMKLNNYSTSKSNLATNSFTDLEEINNKNSISIYPNPSTNYFTLAVSEELIGKSYTICNVSGRIVSKGPVRTLKQKINFQSVPNGIYIFQIDSNATKYKLIKN